MHKCFRTQLYQMNYHYTNFFKQLNFDLYLTKPQLKHLEGIMNAMILKRI
nr:hypothetical protein [Clostridium haemolyticum]